MRRRIEEEPWDDEEPDDDQDTIPCPYCGRPIFDDTPRCPHCENYLSEEEAAPTRKPWWIVLGVAVCLYLVYRWTTWR
jgi:hypothetical protein